jgi:hypothetical protein
MTHDVFISYSSKDKPIADGICANLEAAGIRCWIAPRDIAPGEDWPTAITTAISGSKVMVLVFSANSNSSADVSREIILAANHTLTIIPFKIENVEPEPGKQYYLARTHWMEAMNPPTTEQIQKLVERVHVILPPLNGNIPVQLVPFPPIEKEKTSISTPVNKRTPFRKAYFWIGGALVVIILGFLFWPKVQGMIASPIATPTQTTTNTPQPTQTLLLTTTPIETLLPSATPTIGTVTGQVLWGETPYAGVDVWLCSDWTGSTCKALLYKLSDNGLSTDEQGKFTISGIEPGTYKVITTVPEQLGIFSPGEVFGQTQVNAGETIELDAILMCKYDLQVSAPIIQNGRVTLRWNAYPGAPSYSLTIYDIYWADVFFTNTQNTAATTDRNLSSAKYYYMLAVDFAGGKCVQALGLFTVP